MSTTIPPNSQLCNTTSVQICVPSSNDDACGTNIGPEWVLSTSLESSNCPRDYREQTCVRSSQSGYLGTPQVCCVNNYNATPSNNALCFSDSPSPQDDTCNPEYRSITGTGCEGLFAGSCLGLTSDQAFQTAWTADNQFCSSIINAHANGTPAEVQWAQQNMSQVFDQYFGITNGINTQSSAVGTFQENLYDLCNSNPVACAPALTSLCANQSLTSAEDNNNIAQFCGCYLQPQNYSTYTDSFSIPFQCSPICARGDVIQQPASPNGVGPCTENVCIIDQTTFNFIDSSGGNINFSQICGGCTGECQCIISGVDLNVAQSQVGNINLSQSCGASLNCATPSTSGGPAITVPCAGQSNPSSNPSTGLSTTTIIAIIAIAIVVLIIVIIIIVVIVKSRHRSSVVSQTQ